MVEPALPGTGEGPELEEWRLTGTIWVQHGAAASPPPSVLGQSCAEGRKPFLFSEQNKNYNLKPDPTSAIYSVNSGFRSAS